MNNIKEGTKICYYFGKYYSIPCLYVVLDDHPIPYEYSHEPKKYWIYVPEFNIYRRNISML